MVYLLTWHVEGLHEQHEKFACEALDRDNARAQCRDHITRTIKDTKKQAWRIRITKVKRIKCPHCELGKGVRLYPIIHERLGHVFGCMRCGTKLGGEPVGIKFTVKTKFFRFGKEYYWSDRFTRTDERKATKAERDKQAGKHLTGEFID